MMKRILLSVAVLVIALIGFVSTRPDTYRVARTANIAAPPAVVYAQVANFHRWEAWSPWAKLDPAMKVTHSGTDAGVGSSYAWAGNDKVGEGRMTIVAATPPSSLEIKLEFIRPFASTSESSFAFADAPGGTAATWTMVGHNTFMGKLAGTFMDFDKMIGGDFERGLTQLKAVAEAEAKKPADPAAMAR
jgi:hypothetical protein